MVSREEILSQDEGCRVGPRERSRTYVQCSREWKSEWNKRNRRGRIRNRGIKPVAIWAQVQKRKWGDRKVESANNVWPS